MPKYIGTPSNDQPVPQSIQMEKEKERRNLIIFTLGIIVCLTLAATAYWFLVYKKESKPKSEPESKPESKPKSKPSTTPSKTPSTTTNSCKDRNQAITDFGYDNKIKGWFDVNGTGCKNDYCRMVGNEDTASLSCAMAGQTNEYYTDSKVAALEKKMMNNKLQPSEFTYDNPGIPDFKKFTFIRGKDSYLGDIRNYSNFYDAMMACSGDEKCLAVNTNGWLKKSLNAELTPVAEWNTTDQRIMGGLFVKKNTSSKPI